MTLILAQTFAELFHEIGDFEIISWGGLFTIFFFMFLVWLATR